MKIERLNSFKLNRLSEKEIRNLEILDLISKKGPISRTEISKITGINIVSISNYINNYLDKRIASERGLDISTGGRKPELVELNISDNYVLGVDIGEEETRVVLTDLKIRQIETVKIETSSGTVIGLISDIIEKSRIPATSIRAIGISVLEDTLLAGETIGKHFKIETFYGDACVSAAFGEKRLNPDADAEKILYIHSDLGCGVMVEGNVCRVADETDETLKYLRPWPEGLGILAAAREEVSKGVGTEIVELAKGKLGNIKDTIVMEAATNNDEVASNIVKSISINLGLRIAYLINLLGPDVVAIGGGIEKSGEAVFGMVRKMVQRLALNKYAKDVKIIPGCLGEDACALGAASLAVREIFLRM